MLVECVYLKHGRVITKHKCYSTLNDLVNLCGNRNSCKAKKSKQNHCFTTSPFLFLGFLSHMLLLLNGHSDTAAILCGMHNNVFSTTPHFEQLAISLNSFYYHPSEDYAAQKCSSIPQTRHSLWNSVHVL